MNRPPLGSVPDPVPLVEALAIGLALVCLAAGGSLGWVTLTDLDAVLAASQSAWLPGGAAVRLGIAVTLLTAGLWGLGRCSLSMAREASAAD